MGVDRQNDQPVVLKVLDLRALGDWKSMELFHREAQTLSGLSHFRLPQVLDAFEDPEQHRFVMVQTFVEGRSLADETARWDSESLWDVAFQTLEILSYLHSFSPPVIHRDVSPANIIRNNDAYFLVDFGGVQRVVANEIGGSSVVGSVGYLAPEQMMSKADTRSDLYSLGMTLVRLATATAPPELPHDGLKVTWRGHAPGLDSMLAKFIDKLTDPVADNRFESADAALNAGQAWRSALVTVKKPQQSVVTIESTKQGIRVQSSARPFTKESFFFVCLGAMSVYMNSAIPSGTMEGLGYLGIGASVLGLLPFFLRLFGVLKHNILEIGPKSLITKDARSRKCQDKLESIRTVSSRDNELIIATDKHLRTISIQSRAKEAGWVAFELYSYLNERGFQVELRRL